jgi:hypothetical protein
MLGVVHPNQHDGTAFGGTAGRSRASVLQAWQRSRLSIPVMRAEADLIGARLEGLWSGVPTVTNPHWGCAHSLGHGASAPILRRRLGADLRLQMLAYGEGIGPHGVRLSLHPAGHALGSSQVRPIGGTR